MGNRHHAFVFVVIPLSEVKKFLIIDIIGGTALYYALKLPFHSVIAATAGSMIGPLLIRQSLKRSLPVPFNKR
jgi:hypothetical protein